VIEFYESSAFTKLFIEEAETDAVLKRYRSGRDRAVGRLAGLEVRSVIRRLETSKNLTSQQAANARTALDTELERVPAVALNEEIMLLAQRIMDRNNVRSLDAVQLASAVSLQQQAPIVFICADERLNQSAQTEGLTILRTLDL
jgi:predicted nucleic acid-binding protein